MRVCLESTFLSRAVSRRLRTLVERLRASTRKKRGPAFDRPSFRNQQVAGSSPAAGSSSPVLPPPSFQGLGPLFLRRAFLRCALFRGMIASLPGLRLGHALAFLRLPVPAVTLMVEHARARVYPDHSLCGRHSRLGRWLGRVVTLTDRGRLGFFGLSSRRCGLRRCGRRGPRAPDRHERRNLVDRLLGHPYPGKIAHKRIWPTRNDLLRRRLTDTREIFKLRLGRRIEVDLRRVRSALARLRPPAVGAQPTPCQQQSNAHCEDM